MSKRSTSSKSSNSAPLIDQIDDRRKQANGKISFKVKYKYKKGDFVWVSKQYLSLNKANIQIINIYEMAMDQFSNSGDDALEINQLKQESKNDSFKTKTIKKNNKNNKNNKKNHIDFQKVIQSLIAESSDINQNKNLKNNSSQDEIDREQTQNFTRKLQQQINATNSIEVDKLQKNIISKNITSSDEINIKPKVNNQILNNSQINEKVPENVLFSLEGKFKIIRAKIDQQGNIQFQLKYESGLSVWMDGKKVKKENPHQVIQFYETKITWGC